MKKLCSDGLRHLPSLTALDLNFDQCWHITDIGVKSLSLDGLKHLTSLAALSLNFQWGNITNEGVKKLSDGLKHLTSLTALTLNFEKCEEITSKGEEAIKSWLNKVKLRNITSNEKPIELFRSKIYNFKRGKQNEMLKEKESPNGKAPNLASIKNLNLMNKGKTLYPRLLEGGQVHYMENTKEVISLTDLTLDFASCKNITDEGVKSLCSDGFKYLTSVTALTLDFTLCENITDEGLKRLCCDGLKHLTSLKVLTLNFGGCFNITDEGVRSLCFDGLKHLTSLTALNLNFERCWVITDVGVLSFCSDELMKLISLTALTLDFTECSRISSIGFSQLKMRLKYFGFDSDNS